MRLKIIPYKRGSNSAKLLAETLTRLLGYKVWRGSDENPRRKNIHWGKESIGKLAQFRIFEREGISHVPYTTSKEVAQGYLRAGQTVFARTTHGQGGSGITIVRPGEELPDMPLYTQYVPKQKEFRVHVVEGRVIDVQQKKRRDGAPKGSLIRNLANGWIFAHEDVQEPEGLRGLGLAAVKAVGLDFGAVDIIWNETQNRCYVLEVNSAPGLCQTTANKYAQAFIDSYVRN